MTARDTDWDGVRLHVVTGKGGTGKTTVAGALALALAGSGRKVLLIEVEGRQGIARLFDSPPLPYAERKIAVGQGGNGDATPGGDVYALAIDPEGALMDYLQMFYGMRSAGRALTKVGMVDFATAIAPGLSDVLVTGKATEATRRRSGGSYAYDAVVMDAPPTGRIGRFLNVTSEVSDLAKVGPIRSHADTVSNVIRSPQTAVHFVCTLEEMPVQETLDGITELRAIKGIQVGGVFVNMSRPSLLPREQLGAPADEAAAGDVIADEAVETQIALALKGAGLQDPEQLAADLAAELSEHAARVGLQDRERAELEDAGQPIYELPLITEGIDLAALYRLAAELRNQGAA